jgi:2-alkenal reductase
MNRNRFGSVVGWLFALAALVAVVAFLALFILPVQIDSWFNVGSSQARALDSDAPENPTAAVEALQELVPGSLVELRNLVNPGVVNIRVYIQQRGQTGRAAGSGFVFDEEGHIITNNHVVAQAGQVTIIYHDGTEAHAEVVGTDDDSDLAVLKVDELPEGVFPLPLADSDFVEVGEGAIAIGNPFGLGSSMSLGIVSATGRTIPSGVGQFSIPRAIQTDAAVNPGNSGGPLMNLEGEIIGVNAQIVSGGSQANAGVGFAIPSNVVRLVIPVLIEDGSYQWPWLGVSGGPVSLLVQEANDLETQKGAYMAAIVSGSPADKAGLQGSSGSTEIRGLQVPVGGDVVIEIDDNPVDDFNDLLAEIAFKNPGDIIELTIIRDGEEESVEVELATRPADAGR